MQQSRSNTIEWIFEKAFDQLTLQSANLYTGPFDEISAKTFDSNNLHKIISRLCGIPIDYVKSYLTDHNYKWRILFSKLEKKIDVAILLHDQKQLEQFMIDNYTISDHTFQLAIVNNQLSMLKKLIAYTKKKLTNDLLFYSVELPDSSIYFYLRRECELIPNISIFNKAVQHDLLDVVKDCSELISLSTKNLRLAFESNCTEIIYYLLDVAKSDKFTVDRNLVAYAIMNANLELVTHMESLGLVDWHNDLYYSALLSGSIQIIQFVEIKLPNVHQDHTLDISNTKKGRTSLLLQDISYKRDGHIYFSHTLNYAIQSKSLDIVSYVNKMGYEITVSNFVTAIRQGTVDILEYLCANYNETLPFYLIHYLGIGSYVTDKAAKARVLIASGKLDLTTESKMSVSLYKKETAHLELISQQKEISEEATLDVDYLMKYRMFFTPTKGLKLNYLLINKCKLALELDLTCALDKIFTPSSKCNVTETLVNCLFIFGTITQIRLYYDRLATTIAPSKEIIMELMCYRQIGKLCFLHTHHVINPVIANSIKPMFVMLDDGELNMFAKKLYGRTDYTSRIANVDAITYIIISGNISKIIEWLQLNTKPHPKGTIKSLLQLDNLDICKKMQIQPAYIEELIVWCESHDLFEARNYLRTIGD